VFKPHKPQKQQQQSSKNNELTAINNDGVNSSPLLSCEDVNIPPPQGGNDLELVGINGVSNGRSCCIHDGCGASLQEIVLLCFVISVVTIHIQTEEAVK
jgi:hypothetical protein